MTHRNGPVGRLAIRTIGNEVRAFYARPDTMQDAVLLATVKRALLAGAPDRFDRWLALMREMVGDLIEAKIGERPVYDAVPVAAPEHERGQEPWKGDA